MRNSNSYIQEYSFSGNMRKCCAAWLYLHKCDQPLKYQVINFFDKYPKDLHQYNEAIEKSLTKRVEKSGGSKVALRYAIDQFYNMSLVPSHEFEWLTKSDKRACYFAQKAIEILEIHNEGRKFQFKVNGKKITYDEFVFVLSDNYFENFEEQDTASGKREYFIKVIDLLNVDCQVKVEIVRAIKERYRSQVSLSDFSWINGKNSKQAKWLYNYMIKSIYEKYRTHRLDKTTSNYFFTAIEIFDIWDAPENEKREFLTRLRGAFKQKLYRDRQPKKKRKKSEKKALFSMDFNSEMQVMVNDLADWNGISTSDLIEKLIRDANRKMEDDLQN